MSEICVRFCYEVVMMCFFSPTSPIFKSQTPFVFTNTLQERHSASAAVSFNKFGVATIVLRHHGSDIFAFRPTRDTFLPLERVPLLPTLSLVRIKLASCNSQDVLHLRTRRNDSFFLQGKSRGFVAHLAVWWQSKRGKKKILKFFVIGRLLREGFGVAIEIGVRQGGPSAPFDFD